MIESVLIIEEVSWIKTKEGRETKIKKEGGVLPLEDEVFYLTIFY